MTCYPKSRIIQTQKNRIKKNDLLYGGLTREDYYSIKSAVNEANRKNNISHSIVVLLFWATAFIVFGPDKYSALMKIFPFAFFVCTFSLLCSAVFAKKVSSHCDAGQVFHGAVFHCSERRHF